MKTSTSETSSTAGGIVVAAVDGDGNVLLLLGHRWYSTLHSIMGTLTSEKVRDKTVLTTCVEEVALTLSVCVLCYYRYMLSIAKRRKNLCL